jgi:hypothetical protein
MKSQEKMFVMLLVVLLAVVFSGCTNAMPPRIELSTTSFDFGDINPDEGKLTEIFFVRNSGGNTLRIVSISTSCGCTEAEVSSEEIAPGEQTELVVTYDPSVHPGLVGRIKRVVYVQSNDPLQEEVELELVGNVLPSSKSESGEDNRG